MLGQGPSHFEWTARWVRRAGPAGAREKDLGKELRPGSKNTSNDKVFFGKIWFPEGLGFGERADISKQGYEKEVERPPSKKVHC